MLCDQIELRSDFLPWSALMRIEESPSRITLFTPISAANSRALIEASVSTSNTVAGKCICCESEANTSPASLRMTTPIPARFSLLKSAPSIFSFYIIMIWRSPTRSRCSSRWWCGNVKRGELWCPNLIDCVMCVDVWWVPYWVFTV